MGNTQKLLFMQDKNNIPKPHTTAHTKKPEI